MHEFERLVEVDFDSALPPASTSRHHVTATKETPNLDSLPSLPGYSFHHIDQEQAASTVAPETWRAVQQGCTIKDLVQICPGDIITVLKDLAITKLGTLKASDSDVLNAFGGNAMLTRGCMTAEDPEWRANWSNRLQELVQHKKASTSVGWTEKVKLGAYVVNIRQIADRNQGAILQLLLQKYSSGTASKQIWEFPAIAAMINYHWEHWARPFLLLSFGLFLIWMLCFIAYLILYIESDVKCNILDIPSTDMHLTALFAQVINVLCFFFMCPFAIELYLSFLSQKWQIFHIRNLADLTAVGLQICIFFCHLLSIGIDEVWFKVLLIIQCILLFTKVQKFGKALGPGAYLSEVFIAVIYDVRYLLFYILYSSISAALCLAVLYKNDSRFERNEERGQDFASFPRSLITTFEVVFGSFELDYILDVDHAWIKFLFFFGFQVLMTITVLNLLIAVMADSYSKVVKDVRARLNIGRAEIIDRLDVLRIPHILSKDLQPFIHFLVVEKANDRDRQLFSSPSPELLDDHSDGINSIRQMVQTVNDLRNEMKRMSDEHKRQTDDMSTKLEMLLNTLTVRSQEPATSQE